MYIAVGRNYSITEQDNTIIQDKNINRSKMSALSSHATRQEMALGIEMKFVSLETKEVYRGGVEDKRYSDRDVL